MSPCIDHGQRGDKDGYGSSSVGGRGYRLHRKALADKLGVSVFALTGQVNHTCHNSRCINPEHLYLGTQLQNMQDRKAAGDYADGERNYNAKLTDEDAAYIRDNYIRGHRYRPGNSQQLADKFGVDVSQIRNIASGRQRGSS